MAHYQAPGMILDPTATSTTVPLVVLFERDDGIAVPLLSQLRMTGYDVRAARTPVELFGMLGKQLVALVLVDLGNATAGRREFWVALDAQRRGRSLQVMTFRYTTPLHLLDPDFEPAARALADVEIQGAHEFQKIIEGVRQRIPLNGALPGMALPAPGAGGIPPIGAALGLQPPSQFGQPANSPSQFGGQAYLGQPIPSNPFAGQPAAMPDAASLLGQAPPYSQPFLQQFMGQGMPQQQPGPQAGPIEASPFASPIAGNPFAAAESNSPFAQPYAVNPFAEGAGAPQQGAGMAQMPPFGTAETPFAAAYGAPQPVQSAPFGQPARLFSGQVVDPTPQPNWGQSGFSNGGRQEPLHVGAPVEDAWVPPESDGSLETGLVPSMAYQPFDQPNAFAAGAPAQAAPQRAAQYGQPAIPTDYASLDATAPVPAARQLPAIRPSSATEQALGTVLVEGALLTEQKLEALRGVQQMLAGVNMQFKLGELALLFKFLSPDQLLAALLVSRGLVSPQQIAALGRVKQELGTSGMDHDLGTLLLMFHILPPDQLQSLRAELNQ